MRLSRENKMHLVQIFAPILLILFLLLTPKDAVGCGFLGWIIGVDQVIVNGQCKVGELPWLLELLRNAAGDASAAGWWAAFLLVFLMFLAVTVIDVSLNFTGLSKFVAVDVLGFLLSLDLGGSGSLLFQFIALFITMVLAVLLGM
ncbi:MAG: hypothetical protein ACI8P9_002368 [Parasphingorhabdus sp.]|jgi:hypothetical protein